MKNLLSITLIAISLLFAMGACEKEEEVEEVNPKEDYTPFTLNFEESNAHTMNLYAGQDINIGEVQLWHDMDKIYVKYIIDQEDWCLDTTHIHVAESKEEIPQNEGGPVPGQFDYITEHDNCLKTFTDTLDDYAIMCDDSLVVAAHADVIKKENGEVTQEETAWGAGESLTEQGDWATYFNINCVSEWPTGGTVSVAYEDKRIGEGNDWDYNDFVVDIDVKAIYSGDPDNSNLSRIIFTVRPQEKAAGSTHAINLRSTDVFDCSGDYKLYRDGERVNDNDSTFNGGIDVELIPDTDNYPDSVLLEINITGECGFSLEGWNNNKHHGENLFFDPYLYVNKTQEEIHTGDVRMLVVPVDWQWPTPDGNPIWCQYPDVDEPEEAGDAPQFSTKWWDNYVEDNDCTN